jgi:lipid-A-disaccharide synthase
MSSSKPAKRKSSKGEAPKEILIRRPESSPPEGARRVMVIAGENSGDNFGANLIREMKEREPEMQLYGLGGPRMEKAGVNPLVNIVDHLAIIGFTGVLRNYGVLRRLLTSVYDSLEYDKPDAVVLIDYPGFNQRVAERASELGIPVIYYVCPQFWAWNPRRKYKLAQIVDLLLVIFRFEEGLCREVGINAHYVGHPMLDHLKVTKRRDEVVAELGLDPNKQIIGLLPGSRRSEVVRLLPLLLESAELALQRTDDVQFVLPRASSVSEELIQKYLDRFSVPVVVVDKDRTNVRAAMDFAWVASGTATLETAILGTPLLIVYKVSFLTWIIAQRLVETPYIGLVNIVAEDRIVPELLQDDANAEKISDMTLEYLSNDEKMAELRAGLDRVRERMGGPGAAERGAALALAYLEHLENYPDGDEDETFESSQAFKVATASP